MQNFSYIYIGEPVCVGVRYFSVPFPIDMYRGNFVYPYAKLLLYISLISVKVYITSFV